MEEQKVNVDHSVCKSCRRAERHTTMVRAHQTLSCFFVCLFLFVVVVVVAVCHMCYFMIHCDIMIYCKIGLQTIMLPERT